MQNFTRKAMEIRSGIATLASAVAGDAPVAGSGTTSAGNGRGSKRAERPATTKPIVVPNGHTNPPAPAVIEPRFWSAKKHGSSEICQSYNRGQCNGQMRDGVCGPATCPNADRVHACNKCGTIGHPATECRNGDARNVKQKSKQTSFNNGKGGKGGKGGKRGKSGLKG